MTKHPYNLTIIPMQYVIAQLWAAFNLYLVNRGVIPIPYPAIYITDPIIKRRFASFCTIFTSYPRILQTYFIYNEERYTRHPDLIPASALIDPIFENNLRVGVINKRTRIKRTSYKGKTCCWLMARRASKTTYINIRSVDLLQIPFGTEDYAQQIFHGTKDAADEFFDKLTTQLSVDKITSAKATSTNGKVKLNNNIIEFRYLTSKGGNRGHKPITVAVDEVGFITNAQLNLFMEAVDASMRDNKANITFLTSPAESLENTYLTNLALNPDLSVTFMLPAFFNNAKNRDGQRINSSLNLIASTQKLIKENKKFMVGTTIFGRPLLQGGREIFIRPNFYVFTKQSLDPQFQYSHLASTTYSVEEDRLAAYEMADLRNKYGQPPTDDFKPIRYSFLVSDLSFSGVGDYTVIMHIGVSLSGDLYVLRVFRQPTYAAEIEDCLVKFLLECLASPHGAHLVRLYIEGKDADATPRIRTIKDIIARYVEEKLNPYLEIPLYKVVEGGSAISPAEMKKRLSIKFGYINPQGGYFNDKKSPTELLHGNTLNETLILKTSGNKLQRARTAVSVLARRSAITGEKIKIVFRCPQTDDYIIEDVMNELLSIEAADLSNTNTKKKTAANAHDDAFDTLVYALLIAEKLNDSILRGYDITSNKPTIVSNDGSLNDREALQAEIRRRRRGNQKKIDQLNRYRASYTKTGQRGRTYS